HPLLPQVLRLFPKPPGDPRNRRGPAIHDRPRVRRHSPQHYLVKSLDGRAWEEGELELAGAKLTLEDDAKRMLWREAVVSARITVNAQAGIGLEAFRPVGVQDLDGTLPLPILNRVVIDAAVRPKQVRRIHGKAH